MSGVGTSLRGMVNPSPPRTVAQKMGIKAGARAHLRDAPASAVAAMELPELELLAELTGEFDYLHLFVTTQERMREHFGALRDRLRPGGALWVSWPKGGKLGSDLTIKSVIAIGYERNLVESTCLEIDEVWSGLKFTHPKPGKRYANSYGRFPARRAEPAPARLGDARRRVVTTRRRAGKCRVQCFPP